MSWVEPFKTITAKVHSDQAKWWLNGFWSDGAEQEAEKIWQWAHQFIEIASGEKVVYGKRHVEIKEVADLDEFQSHRFLELNGETLTVQALRKKLQALDIDNNHRLCLIEYLLNRYNKTPEQVVKAPQGTIPPDVMAAAEKKQQDASNALNQALSDAETAAATLQAAKAAKAEADRAFEENKVAQAAAEAAYTANVAAQEAATAAFNENKAAQARADEAFQKVKEAEAPLKAAEEEVKAAVDELKAQEDAYAGKIKTLQDKIADTTLSTVQVGKAKNELEQLKSEDPLPLRKAKITSEAALKKAEKARKPFKEATDAAAIVKAEADAAAEVATKRKEEADKAAAEAAETKAQADAAAAQAEQTKIASDAAAAQAEAAKQAADDSLAAAKNAFAEAEAALAELTKEGSGTPMGALWWMNRQLTEKKKYMPKN